MPSRIHTVDPKTLKKTIQALQLYEVKAKETKTKNSSTSGNEGDTKKSLFEEDKKISLQVDFIMVPTLKNKSFFFDTATAPTFDKETAEVCLIVKDEKAFQKKHEKAKYEQQTEQTKLFKAICPYVSDVIPFSVVKSDFKTFEQKRILCNSFDFFAADRDVFDKLPSLLGGYFIKSKKMPRKINNLSEENPNINQILQSKFSQTLWHVDGRGTCTNIIIGKSNFELTDLAKNAELILDQVAANVPRGWNFIKSVHVKLEGSIALEIYRKDEKVVHETESDADADADAEAAVEADAKPEDSQKNDIKKLSPDELHAIKKNDLPDSRLVNGYKRLLANKQYNLKKKILTKKVISDDSAKKRKVEIA